MIKNIINKILFKLGYVEYSKVPEVGRIMSSLPLKDGIDVTVLELNECLVCYKLPDGRVRTRSRKGFEKNYICKR